MRKNKLFFIALGVLFFLAAVTFYLNRVIFPVQFKKIVIAQAEGFLKRKVEIEALHLNWLKGLVIDKVKIYQKDGAQVFLQARQVSMGLVWIPGFKQQRITIPFINIEEPSAHLIYTGNGQWNFSDLLAAPKQEEKPSPFTVALAGIHMTGGKARIDDTSGTRTWTELLDNVNAKAGLSYRGISFELSADIPQKQGLLALDGAYQPLTRDLQAQVRLKNIRPAEYLVFFPPVQGLELKNTLIQDTDVTFNYTKDRLEFKGDATLKDIGAGFNGQTAAAETLRVHVNHFDMDKDFMNFDGDATAQNVLVRMGPGQAVKGNIALEKLKLRRDKDGTQVTGALLAKGLDVRWGLQTLSGDLSVKPMTVQAKNGAIDFIGAATLENMHATPAVDTDITGSVALPSLAFTFTGDTWTVKTAGKLNNGQIGIGKDKNITGGLDLTLEAACPLKDPQRLRYSGTINVRDAQANGFPFSPLKAINFKSELQTDRLDIRSFALDVMDTPVQGAGTVTNFKDPVLNVEASGNKIDLGRLKDILPGMFQQYGLQTSGEASFNIKFQGMVSDPLSGKINVRADLRNANVSSSIFNQSISNVSGSVNGTPDSMSWNDFTGTYLGKTYTLTGTLADYKNPQVKTSLDGEGVKLKADLGKNGDVLTIKALTGKYLNIAFDAGGSVILSADGKPVLDVSGKLSLHLEDMPALLPPEMRKMLEPLKANGAVEVQTSVKGRGLDWKAWTTDTKISGPSVSLMGYTLNDAAASITQHDGKVSNLTVDATAYDGKVHAVGSGDLTDAAMPFDLALNVDALDIHKLKMDIPQLRSEEVNGKFYMTMVSSGNLTNIKDLKAKGSLAIREGFLTEFKLFKGLLGALNEALRLGQVMITDVEGNFTVEDRKATTDNLRLKSPTIVLLTEGWVGFDQNCDLKVTVDMTSGIIPSVAQDVLRSLEIHVYDNILNPKFTKKISVPQVINSIIKTIGIFN